MPSASSASSASSSGEKSIAVLIKKAMAKMPLSLNTKKGIDEYYKNAMKEIVLKIKATEKAKKDALKAIVKKTNVDAKKLKVYRGGVAKNIAINFDDIDLDSIYDILLSNGFYNNISIKSGCYDTIKDDSIIIPKSCVNRLSNIVKYKNIGSYILLKSPCRIGRSSRYCSKNFKDCKIVENHELCPICNILNTDIISPCEPLNNIIRLYIKFDYPLIIIPNAYPYLEKHFLIVSPNHNKQMDSLKNKTLVHNIFTICNIILQIGKGVVFFNGICGNSLEHFHCQYTTTIMPLFNMMSENHKGFFDEGGLRGYSIIISLDNIDLFIKCTDIIIKNNLTYNFIVRKVLSGLQVVLFVRNCIIPKGVKDLNFGSTELSGIIVSNEELTINEEDIKKYTDATNRPIDYDFAFFKN